jgi:predicted secreted protein
MGRRRDERDEYVVELQVAGTAVLSVHADSSAEAAATAELQVKAGDVTQLDEVTGVTVVKVGDDVPVAVARELAETPVAPSQEPGHGGTE